MPGLDRSDMTKKEYDADNDGTIDASALSSALGSKTFTSLTGGTTLQSTNIDAGANGTAGAVDVFPATASKGKLTISATNNSGDTTTTISSAAQAGARTYTVPDVGTTTGTFVLKDSNGKVELEKLGSAAASASGLLLGVGTSANPATTSTAGANLTEIRGKTTATSGDNRLDYRRYEIGGAGGSGECTRNFTDLTAAAGNAHGQHTSLQAGATGYVTGLGAGLRQQLYIKNEAVHAAGTYYGGLTEIYSAGSASSLAAVTKHAIHSFQASGDSTGAATVVNCFDVVGTAAADATKMISSVSLAELPSGTVGIAVLVNGTRYYIPAVVATEWN